ncbi:MAG: 3-deoxy-manno-octulosonate cytidylyltransferase [Chitinophagales bacterium]|nr:3-deoxy-manno-octulosonate cytidylyltransferase [Bacteroidota bacterium]MCB9044326.1 3-deoxy-manno-octulosonate cytidylyltransferase [Chitinophagales bacterium]
MKPQVLGIIPARYASTRFPGKPLVDIAGKTMIQRTWEQVKKCSDIDDVWIATDDERIFAHCQEIGANCIMTDSVHINGTQRIAEAAKRINSSAKYIVNIQGDEPFIQPQQVSEIVQLIQTAEADIATLIYPVQNAEELNNPNVVKVVRSLSGRALYFSRCSIPYAQTGDTEIVYYKHLGIYAFTIETLQKIVALPVSALALTESLEQLTWLENDFNIQTAETKYVSKAIDTPQDLVQIIEMFKL